MAAGQSLGRAFIEVKADLSDFPSELKAKLEAALREGVAGVDTTHFEEEMGKVGERAGEELGDKIDKGAKKKMDQAGRNAAERFSYGFTAFLGRMLFNRASMWTSLIVAAGSAIASIMPAVYALAGAAPAALGGLVASAVTLKLAFHGVGEAISSALSGKWNAKSLQALKDLAPAARSFVQEVATLRPLLKGIQQDVQQAFFAQLEGSLTRVARNLLPSVRAGLAGLASGLGAIGRSVLDALSGTGARAGSVIFFANLNRIMLQLAPAIGAVTRAITQLIVGSMPLVSSLGTGLANLLTRFAAFIQRAQDSGAMVNFFETALAVLRNFGALLGQVVGLWNALVSGLGSDGGAFLFMLGQVVGVLTDLFKSAAGQQLLGVLRDLISVLAQLLVQVLTPLLPAIAQLLGAIGGQLVRQIAAATPAIAQFAQALVPMISFLADHADVIEPIALAIVGMAAGLKAYAIAVGIAQTVTEAWTAAMIAFDVAADANPIGAIVLAIEAIIAGVVLLIVYWKDVKKYGSEAWNAIKDAAGAVWDWLKSAGSDIADFFTGIGDWFQALPGRILTFLESLPGRIADLVRRVFLGGVEAIGIGVGLWLAELLKLPDQIATALSFLGGLLHDLWFGAWHSVVDTYHSWLDAMTAEWHALPGQIKFALNELPGILGGLMRDAWNWAKREWNSAVDTVVGWAQALPGRIGHFFDNIGHSILGGLRSGINQVIDSFNHGIDLAAGWTHIALPHLPHFAQGGIVDQPTLAVIGEKAREVVLPTDNPRRAWELMQQSGLLGTLQQPVPTPVVYVTAMLDSGDLLRVVDVRVEHAMEREASLLAGGVRTP